MNGERTKNFWCKGVNREDYGQRVAEKKRKILLCDTMEKLKISKIG